MGLLWGPNKMILANMIWKLKTLANYMLSGTEVQLFHWHSYVCLLDMVISTLRIEINFFVCLFNNLSFLYYFFYFTILYWFCHTSTWILMLFPYLIFRAFIVLVSIDPFLHEYILHFGLLAFPGRHQALSCLWISCHGVSKAWNSVSPSPIPFRLHWLPAPYPVDFSINVNSSVRNSLSSISRCSPWSSIKSVSWAIVQVSFNFFSASFDL